MPTFSGRGSPKRFSSGASPPRACWWAPLFSIVSSPNSRTLSRQNEPLTKDVAISVRNVSKKFRLFATPSARLAEALHPFRKAYHHEFWAVRDVSFTVDRGEVHGILGKNGSGKSTLAQIICSAIQAREGAVQDT